MGSGGRRRARGGRRGLLAAAAALLALAACAPAAVRRDTARAFPGLAPHDLAHLLADFSTHPHASHPWVVEEERGNYTEWSYSVSFSCGARCAGSARVRAATAGGGAPAHGRAPRHAVRLELRACTRLPLLAWPISCDELEVEWDVRRAEGAGSVADERAVARCGALRVLSGGCGRRLRELRDLHVARLRAAGAVPA